MRSCKIKTTLQEIILWAHTTDIRQLPVSMLSDWMEDLMVFEKQIIKQAFNDGREDALSPYGQRKYLTAEHYYRKTFDIEDNNDTHKPTGNL